MQPAKAIIPSPMVCFDSGWRTIEEIVAIAEKAAPASLSAAPEFRAVIARGADFLDRRLAEDGVIYGVTTGFGDSCTVAVEPALIAELPRHLYTFHGCGLGAHFTAKRNPRGDRRPIDLTVQGFFRRQRRLVGAAS